MGWKALANQVIVDTEQELNRKTSRRLQETSVGHLPAENRLDKIGPQAKRWPVSLDGELTGTVQSLSKKREGRRQGCLLAPSP